jgi:alpha-tubulin suppressor-like RCC1 family protein
MEPVLREVVQVASGWEHVCAAKNDGTLWCWGGNVHGQLGLGTLGVHTRRDAPAQVALERVQSVSASWKHTCAATALGELYCWGDGSHGRLGTGDAETRAEPTKVELEGVVAVAVGEEHSCAIQADTGLSCWGYNFSGQLGLGEDWAEKPSCTKKEQDYVLDCLRPESLGMPTVSSFATGGSHTCAILGGSTLSCWGWNADEQLGVASPERSWTALPVTGIGWGRVTQVSASRTATCAVAGVGELYCWGDGSLGRLGLGEKSGRRPPTRLALESVAQVSVGYAHACALTRDGALWCWGSNAAGQLGLGDGWLSRQGCLREKYSDDERGRGDRDVSLEYCVGPQQVTVGP